MLMAENVDNLILEHLRAIRSDLSGLRDDVRSLTVRTGNVETELGHLHGVVAEQSVRIDKLAGRIERLERRLELSE
jgi:hypothetical protein